MGTLYKRSVLLNQSDIDFDERVYILMLRPYNRIKINGVEIRISFEEQGRLIKGCL